MRLLVVLLFLLAAFFAAVTGGGCNRRCNSLVVPYPFGFSGACPILLACNATNSTPLLPHSTTAAPYPILSFNYSTSTFIVSLAPSCNRSVVDAKVSLSGAGYGISSRTGLLLRGGCRATGTCTVSANIMAKQLHTTAQCGANGNDIAWTCVATPPTNNTAALRGQGQFMAWDSVDAAGCEDLLSAVVYAAAGMPSLEFGVAELGWWLNGTCAGATADGQCVVNATCHVVKTPSEAWGHRCACPDGMSGDGFADGDGCLYGEFVRLSSIDCLWTVKN
ncbi:hypothetical protein BAE44_0002237 [Dichanthelium oligosanthes]|uniref:Wall-associated receptor kinase galacturonan-binding domain-containing protein n=1 Tax=Dichanthelium oligosanthes TaxID=888268 RepID=A0A1E5WHB6_9POAL|nr:hypothetical protein BAE44_0002237 [Dichanthelium oligosanthes]